jgi:hypothetical protein
MEEAAESIADRYVPLDLLGRGGMGSVYRVRDKRDGRELAFKRLSAEASAERVTAELFEREFHTLSQLAHPRIIEVYDYGIDAEGAYYTMELLAGQDVRALGKTPWRRTCEILRDVASSLAILHSRRLLHGDVSPRNVRCTLDGRAKLLDFGAMMPMGVAKRVVGTPPFIAPELLHMQALDGRSDLYALGALGYYLLTGRQAYPAEQVRQLRDIWRRPLQAPMLLEPEVPAALSGLIVELLQLNRDARPRSAAVVMERLCSIASLPYEETGEVARAYLATPTLVGRDAQVAIVRDGLVSAMRGSGAVIVASGPGGSGRSRFVDACVLEAKLLGSQVVRLDRSASEHGEFGAAAELCRQLFELAPKASHQAAQLHGAVLAHVIGVDLVRATPAETRPDRRTLLLALRDFTLSVVRSLRLLIAVDDADGIDEASASLLMALGQKAKRRPLCIVLSINSESEGSAALDMLVAAAQTIPLEPLTEAQTEQLMAAVFGDADHVFTIARGVHAIARGNPRATMQLATHLVEQGIARYEAGSFVLPERLREQDLPPSLAAALEKRMAKLDADALELARVLALSDPSEIPVANYVDLTSHADRARTYRSVDQLVQLQLLESQGDRYRLGDPTWRAALSAGAAHADQVAWHARLARLFEQVGGTMTRRSYHLMESEQSEAAIRLILTQYLKDPNEPQDPLTDYVPGLIEQLERAAVAGERLGLPAPLRVELRMKVSGASQFLGDLERFRRVAPPLMAELERDTGLLEYLALDPNMEPMARLTEALTRAQKRYDDAPLAERGLPLIDGIRELSRLCAIFTGMAIVSQDYALLERVPSLAPFAPLSPAVAVIEGFISAQRDILKARDELGCAALLKMVERLEQPDGGGLGKLYQDSLKLGALYIVGLCEASWGVADAGARVAILERSPGHRVNAQRVHAVCQLMQGNAEAAVAAQRRAELMMLQDGQQQRYPGTTARAELYACWLSADLAGLKQISERIAQMTERFANWDTLMHVSRCLYRLVQGDAAGALHALEPALAVVKPLEYRDWASVGAAHVQVLVSLGRIDEALELGFRHMQVCKELQLAGYVRVAHATIEALIAAERAEEAIKLTDELLVAAEQKQVRGLALGALYELRARAAAACGDEPAFYDFCERCAEEYHADRNPALAARYQRMFRDVQGRLQVPPANINAYPAEAGEGDAHSALSSVYSRLLECVDSESRAQCALTILAEHMGAEHGFLYCLREGQLEMISSLAQIEAPPELQGLVDQCLASALDPEAVRNAEGEGQGRGPSAEAAPITQVLPRAESDSGSASMALSMHTRLATMYPILLKSKSEGESVIAGVAVLGISGQQPRMPPEALIDSLATAMLEQDDVDPATCLV